MNGPRDERTVDVVDTYAHASSRKPLIGGWELIDDYFERMKNPDARLAAIKAQGKTGSKLHGFQNPLSRTRLRQFDEFDDGSYTTNAGKSIRRSYF